MLKWQHFFPTAIVQRGRDYYKQNKVRSLIQDGDILFVEPVRDFADIPDRRIVVAKFRDDRRSGEESVVCKRFRREGRSFLLTSDNPAGRVIPFVPADLEWIGVVVRKITDLL